MASHNMNNNNNNKMITLSSSSPVILSSEQEIQAKQPEDQHIRMTPSNSTVIDVDIESEGNADLQTRLHEQDPRLGTDQVINVINDLIKTQKQTKVNNKILAVGLVATSLIGAASTTYLAIKESRHVETLQTDIKESSISDAVVVQLNNNEGREDDQDSQGRVVVGFVALEDVEQSWRDAQKGLTVTSTVTVEDEDNNEHLETVFTVNAANAKLQVDINGNKNYSNLATQSGGTFEVGCDGTPGHGYDVCKVFLPGGIQRRREKGVEKGEEDCIIG